MEFALTEEQQALRKSVRQFLQSEAPLSHAREMEDDPLGYSPRLWRKLAALDWIGLDYPNEYGGLGASLVDVALVVEEMGRCLFPSPYFASAIMAGQTILAAGDQEQKSELLPRIAAGEKILSLALTEPSGTYEPAGIETKAIRHGDSYSLTGTKLFVPFAHAADHLVIAARNDGGSAEDAISLFVVSTASSGISITALPLIGGERQSAVELREVAVPSGSLLGAHGGWPVLATILDKSKAAMAAQMVGGAQAVLEITVKYVKERSQFGVPIGSFQAIQHRLADLATEIEGARWLAYRAALEIGEGNSTSLPAMAKAFISEVYVRAARAAVQFHGGYGYMKEYDVQLFFRHAKAAEAILGDEHYNRELVARQMGLSALGDPQSRSQPEGAAGRQRPVAT